MSYEDSYIDFVKVPTRHLRFLMDHYRKINSPKEFSLFVEYLRKMAAKYTLELEKFPPGRERALAATQLINAELLQAEKIPASCKKGCAHCCRLEVEITQDEVDHLAHLVQSGYQIDMTRLPPTTSNDKRCVFLTEDNTCGIYENRPNTCRKLRVVTPPRECEIGSGQPHPITIPLAEVIISVALSFPENGPIGLSRGLAIKLGKMKGLNTN